MYTEFMNRNNGNAAQAEAQLAFPQEAVQLAGQVAEMVPGGAQIHNALQAMPAVGNHRTEGACGGLYAGAVNVGSSFPATDSADVGPASSVSKCEPCSENTQSTRLTRWLVTGR